MLCDCASFSDRVYLPCLSSGETEFIFHLSRRWTIYGIKKRSNRLLIITWLHGHPGCDFSFKFSSSNFLLTIINENFPHDGTYMLNFHHLHISDIYIFQGSTVCTTRVQPSSRSPRRGSSSSMSWESGWTVRQKGDQIHPSGGHGATGRTCRKCRAFVIFPAQMAH